MIIAFDARCIRPGKTGIGYYARHLLEAMLQEATDDRFLLLTLRNSKPPAIPLPSHAEWVPVDADYESHPRGDWWEHRVLPRLLDRWGVDIFHGPAFVVPFGRRPPRAVRVASLHDLSPFTFPRAYSLRFRLYLRWAVRHSLAAADRVLCGCTFVRNEALRLWPALDPAKFRVVPLAPAPLFQGSASDSATPFPVPLPPSFLLMVGVFEVRKNPLFLLPLYEALRARMGRATPPLVWAGRPGFGSRAALRALEPLRREGLFHLVEGLHQEDLLTLYRRASVLVYPSLHEGFGLPVLEAMSQGLPVLAAPLTSLPEVVGEGGRLPTLDAPGEWARAIEEILRDPDAANRWRSAALRHAAGYSWRKTARETLAVYAEARDSR